MSGATTVWHDDAVLAMVSPLGWAQVATRGTPNAVVPYRHSVYLDRALRELDAGLYDTLVVQMPVQHGKSTACSQWFPAWWICRHPDSFVGIISHSSEFAADRFGSATRKIVELYGQDWFGVAVDPRSSARDRWNIAGHDGQLIATGIERPPTGRRLDLCIVDDPIASESDAQSAAHREFVWSKWQMEIATRFAPGTKTVVVMSRWHEDDFSGRLQRDLNERGVTYRLVDLPALALEEDALGRAIGEALWPQVRPREWLEEQRRRVSPRGFDAQFQGRPRPASGAVFQREHFRRYSWMRAADGAVIFVLRGAHGEPIGNVRAADCVNFGIADPAISQKKTSDYTCIGSFAVTPARDLIVLDMIHDRISGAQQVPTLRTAMARWRLKKMGIEAVAYQSRLVEEAVADGLPAVEITRGRESKLARAYVAQARYEMHTVYHPTEAPWLDEFEMELLRFPAGVHDDYVDVISDAAAAVALAPKEWGRAQGVRV